MIFAAEAQRPAQSFNQAFPREQLEAPPGGIPLGFRNWGRGGGYVSSIKRLHSG